MVVRKCVFSKCKVLVDFIACGTGYWKCGSKPLKGDDVGEHDLIHFFQCLRGCIDGCTVSISVPFQVPSLWLHVNSIRWWQVCLVHR